MSAGPCAGLLLAGGAARRMGGEAKAFVSLGGRPMLEQVLERFAPQVAPCWLAVGQGDERFAQYAFTALPDAQAQARGPLAGLLAGLEALQRGEQEWLALCPCDAPFLPRDLVGRLQAEVRPGDQVLVPRRARQLQPTFSLWHRSTREPVAAALATPAGAGLLALMNGLQARSCEWPAEDEPDPFFNVNTPTDLAQAAQWLQRDRQHSVPG